MAEEIKNVELNEVENNEQTAEVAETTNTTNEQKEQKPKVEPLPEQKPFLYTREERTILDEMERRAKDDAELAKGLQDKDKSIRECYAFITHRAKKMAEGNCAMIEDSAVFAWAVFYYTQRREILDLEFKAMAKPAAPAASSTTKATSKAKNEKKEEKKDNKPAAPAKAEEKAETKPAEDNKEDDEDYPTLF